MIQRCENPKDPRDKHSLDRIDNAQGYAKDNCRWATMQEQLRNTRRNIVVTSDGRTHCLPAWCEEVGMAYDTTRARLVKLGWPTERAFTAPVKHTKPKPPITDGYSVLQDYSRSVQ
jgi:hypothetical protein